MNNELHTLLENLINADAENADEFKMAVDTTIRSLNLDVGALSDEFEAAPATIDRWRSGVSKPMVSMRKIIVRYLIETVKKKVDDEEKNSGFK